MSLPRDRLHIRGMGAVPRVANPIATFLATVLSVWWVFFASCRHPCVNTTLTHPHPLETPVTTSLWITRFASLRRNPLVCTTGLGSRKLQREICMLMIERRGEDYLVHFLPTNDHVSAFALPSQRFPDIQSLTGFLLHVLHVPQESVDEALRTGSLGLSPEQIERWRA
jgi:hypothetical protein